MKTVTFLLIAFTAQASAFQGGADVARGLDNLYNGKPGAIELFLPNIVEPPFVKEPSRRTPDMVLPVDTQIADPLTAVTIEVNVPAVSDEESVLRHRLGVLESKYGFVWDQTPPRRVGRYTIQPYPNRSASGKGSYRVRGLMRSSQINEIAREPMVLRVSPERQTFDAETIEAFISEHREHVLGLRGVVGIERGFDCGIRSGEHRHILPHKPAVVILIDASAADDLMAGYLMSEVPQLRAIPFLFEKAYR